jgi:recombination DNA repair RAD52 pathway protein
MMDMKALEAPLDKRHVKARDVGRSSVSYIEAWHAIAEANRIFGFDGWTRETVAATCVSERPRTIGKGQYEKDGWGVTYTSKVRVAARGPDGEWVTREGSGAGHGIDADCGQAHESALKEAESDAMKRALMTFGNPFGLALYDKAQTNVEDGAAREQFERFVAEKVAIMDSVNSLAELGAFWKSLDREIQATPQVIAAKNARKAELAANADAAFKQAAE